MDIVIIPHGSTHWIADQVGRKLMSSQLAYNACELGSPPFQQGELTNRIICGHVHYEDKLKHPIIQSLPPVLHFSQIALSDPVWAIVELIDKEMQDDHQSIHIVNHLTEVLFLQLLKKYVSESNICTGFFSAVHDPKIYLALELIHQNPNSKWSLSSLGNVHETASRFLTCLFVPA